MAAALRAEGIRLVLDGVFHHVGRDFGAFRDLLRNGDRSAFRGWFSGVDFGTRGPRGDPFVYDAWEGHFGLVKLNLRHPDVRAHLFGAVRSWVERFGIDGLRLDVAYALDPLFVRDLAAFGRGLRPDFWVLGEAIHGDYRRVAGPGRCDAVTNYECYKGLYSSHNDRNYFEIAHSLDRLFGAGGLYRGLTAYNFADNHDVNRVASVLRNPAHLYPLYLLLFTTPGVPSVYAGSEWAMEGVKAGGDDLPLRPVLPSPAAAASLGRHPDLAAVVARLAAVRRRSPALRRGTYRPLHVAPEQFAFAREADGDQVVVAADGAGADSRLGIPVAVPDGEAFEDLLAPGDRVEVRGGRAGVPGADPGAAGVAKEEAGGRSRRLSLMGSGTCDQVGRWAGGSRPEGGSSREGHAVLVPNGRVPFAKRSHPKESRPFDPEGCPPRVVTVTARVGTFLPIGRSSLPTTSFAATHQSGGVWRYRLEGRESDDDGARCRSHRG